MSFGRWLDDVTNNLPTVSLINMLNESNDFRGLNSEDWAEIDELKKKKEYSKINFDSIKTKGELYNAVSAADARNARGEAMVRDYGTVGAFATSMVSELIDPIGVITGSIGGAVARVAVRGSMTAAKALAFGSISGSVDGITNTIAMQHIRHEKTDYEEIAVAAAFGAVLGGGFGYGLHALSDTIRDIPIQKRVPLADEIVDSIDNKPGLRGDVLDIPNAPDVSIKDTPRWGTEHNYRTDAGAIRYGDTTTPAEAHYALNHNLAIIERNYNKGDISLDEAKRLKEEELNRYAGKAPDHEATKYTDIEAPKEAFIGGFADGLNAPNLTLSEVVARAFKNNVPEIFNHLLGIAGDTPIRIVRAPKTGDNAYGRYVWNRNGSIGAIIVRDGGDLRRTLVHEVAHAAMIKGVSRQIGDELYLLKDIMDNEKLFAKLQPKQQSALIELERMREALIPNLTSREARNIKKNVDEFISDALSDPNIIEKMKKIKWDNTTLFNRLIEIFADILGFTEKPSMYNEFIRQFTELIDPIHTQKVDPKTLSYKAVIGNVDKQTLVRDTRELLGSTGVVSDDLQIAFSERELKRKAKGLVPLSGYADYDRVPRLADQFTITASSDLFKSPYNAVRQFISEFTRPTTGRLIDSSGARVGGSLHNVRNTIEVLRKDSLKLGRELEDSYEAFKKETGERLSLEEYWERTEKSFRDAVSEVEQRAINEVDVAAIRARAEAAHPELGENYNAMVKEQVIEAFNKAKAQQKYTFNSGNKHIDAFNTKRAEYYESKLRQGKEAGIPVFKTIQTSVGYRPQTLAKHKVAGAGSQASTRLAQAMANHPINKALGKTAADFEDEATVLLARLQQLDELDIASGDLRGDGNMLQHREMFINLPDIEDLLDTSYKSVYLYDRGLNGKIAMQAHFGVYKKSDWSKKLDELDTVISAEGASVKERQQVRKQLDYFYNEALGYNSIMKDRHSTSSTLTRLALKTNYINFGGGFGANQLAEFTSFFARHGIFDTLSTIIKTVRRNPAYNTPEFQEMLLTLGAVGDNQTLRNLAFNDIGSGEHRYLASLERLADKGSSFMAKVSLLDPIIKYQEALGATIYWNKVAKAVTAIRAQKPTNKADMRELNRLGVSTDMLQQLARERAFDVKGGAVVSFNLPKWSNPALFDAFEKGMLENSRFTVIKADGWDMPRGLTPSDNKFVQLMVQFLRFPIASLERSFLAVDTPRAVLGVGLGVPLVATIALLREQAALSLGLIEKDDAKFDISNDDEDFSATKRLLAHSLMRLPTSAALSVVAEKAGGTLTKGAAESIGLDEEFMEAINVRQQHNIAGVVGGVTGSRLQRIWVALSDIQDGEVTESTINTATSLIPFITHPVMWAMTKKAQQSLEE